MGGEASVGEFVLDPDAGFATSPMEDGDDRSAFRVKGDSNAELGALDLADVSVDVNDYDKIVQHPGACQSKLPSTTTWLSSLTIAASST
jgi:hypothetical protein